MTTITATANNYANNYNVEVNSTGPPSEPEDVKTDNNIQTFPAEIIHRSRLCETLALQLSFDFPTDSKSKY